MSTHALLSPSGAHRWMRCPGSVALTRDMADESSTYADEGTAAHALAAMALTEVRPCAGYVGRLIDVGGGTHVPVTDDMAAGVQRYVDAIVDYAGDGERYVEQRVRIDHVTGEPEAGGTADAIVIRGDELQVHDLKFGRGVKVSAEKNPQLILYALGALEVVSLLGFEPRRVRMVIHQPRLESVSEWDCDLSELEAHRAVIAAAARAVRQACEAVNVAPFLRPAEDACRFCKAKATCPALARHVQEAIGRDFGYLTSTEADVDQMIDDGGDLAQKMAACGLIEDWIKAVRAEVERRLLAGEPVPGFKLVQGRAGPRAWSDSAAAEALLREKFRLTVEQAYELKLISPTQAEKLAKDGTIGPRQWPQLEALVTRSSGKPSVAPESDRRPALERASVMDSFEALA